MLDVEDRPLTFVRFGLQRKKDFLRDVRGAYDGLVLPANILLYQYKSTPSIVFMTRRPFFVDPMSYLFGQPFEQFKRRVRKGPEFKPSFHRLMSGHGLNPEQFLNKSYEALLKLLDSSEKNRSRFTRNALSFQRDQVWTTICGARGLVADEDLESLVEDRFRPSFLIPPYFLFSGSSRSQSVTTVLNEKILDVCQSQRSEWGDMFPMVFVKKEHLLNGLAGSAVEVVTRNEFPGYCIWVDDFDERAATMEEIAGLISLVRSLSGKEKKQVVMMYGGFFSMLLYHFGLTCVCHGIAYSEAKSLASAAQSSTGPAPIRYYILELHRFLTLENALRVLRARPDLLCSCPACRRVVGDDPENVTKYESEEALSEIHFLYNRNLERQMIGESTPAEIVEHLEWTISLNHDIDTITRKYRVGSGYEERAITDTKYMQNWRAAFESGLD